MNALIYPSKIKGLIQAPSSKSLTQRALCASLLVDGSTYIRNPIWCDDSKAVKKIIEDLGAFTESENKNLRIAGGLNPRKTVINCSESGLAIRMFTPVVALLKQQITLTGKGSLKNRPVDLIHQTLKQLQVNIVSNNGYLPVTVQGPIKSGIADVDGSISSQGLTGLLITLPTVDDDSVLYVKNLQSKSYIDLTIDFLEHFGISIENQNYEIFKIKGSQKFKSIEYTIEGDWSNAAFHLVAGAISGEVRVENLNCKSKQGDKQILDVLMQCGAKVSIGLDYVEVSKSKLNAFYFDASNCPDLFPPLVALAANSKGISVIKGINRLIYKESNRADVLCNEFAKLGVGISLQNNEMVIRGGEIKGNEIHSNHDHRIVMAATIAAGGSENPVKIICAEAVEKSYPDFFQDYKLIGGCVETTT